MYIKYEQKCILDCTTRDTCWWTLSLFETVRRKYTVNWPKYC